MTSSSSSSAAGRQRQQFSSEGFDLDAVSSAADGVIYEIGGGVSSSGSSATQKTPEPQTKEEEAKKAKEEETKKKKEEDPCAASEAHKAEGNSHFKSGEYLDAYDCYTSAIESCPGPFDGDELLRLRDEFDERERERLMERHRQETERKRREEEERYNRRRREGRGDDNKKSGDGDGDNKDGAGAGAKVDEGGEEGDDDDDDKKDDEKEKRRRAEFVPPHHPHSKKLSIYHCNRAACSLHLSRHDESISDCTVAVLLNKSYAKAYLRRMAAYEHLDKTEEALRDAKSALFYEPDNGNARKNARRLEKIEAERMEKLKEETMGKLKDLGNSILGNFGLSLDNFKTEQDPKTGGYSISFQQNA